MASALKRCCAGFSVAVAMATTAAAVSLLSVAHPACAQAAALQDAQVARNQVVSATVLMQFTRACVLCHAAGEGGAPRIGVSEDWRPRIARGEQELLRHTIEGYNNMPPLGYCMSCDTADFKALIHFMARGN